MQRFNADSEKKKRVHQKNNKEDDDEAGILILNYKSNIASTSF